MLVLANKLFIDRFSEIERDNKHLLKKMKNILTSEDKFTVQEKDIQSKLLRTSFRMAIKEEHPSCWIP